LTATNNTSTAQQEVELNGSEDEGSEQEETSGGGSSGDGQQTGSDDLEDLRR